MTRFHDRRSSRLLIAGLALTCLPVLIGSAAPLSAKTAHRSLPDAFLPVPARSVGEIVAQVQADPVVRRHYARYLSLPPSRVAQYLRANLVPSHLSQAGRYTVYLVRPNGLIYPTMLTIPKGSPVFALRSGTALLTWNEGDPLVRSQRTVRYDPSRKPLPPPIAPPMAPPRVEQVIVPTHPETTVVPPPAPPSPEPAPAASN
jgi:hypothetical protein